MRDGDVEPAGTEERPDDDGSEVYGVFGEGRPRHFVGESDQPPRRRPRKKPGARPEGATSAER